MTTEQSGTNAGRTLVERRWRRWRLQQAVDKITELQARGELDQDARDAITAAMAPQGEGRTA